MSDERRAGERLEFSHYRNEFGEWYTLLVVRDNGPRADRVLTAFVSPTPDNKQAAEWGPRLARQAAAVEKMRGLLRRLREWHPADWYWRAEISAALAAAGE